MMVSNALAVQAGNGDREDIQKVHLHQIVTVFERRAPVAISVDSLSALRNASGTLRRRFSCLDAASRSVGFGKVPRPRCTGPEPDAASTATAPDQYRW